MRSRLTDVGYRSIFTSATRRERIANFEAYWAYSVGHDGEILQDRKDLVKKRDILAGFQAHPVRSRRPLADPARFYRNHVFMQDDPRTLERKTLLLTFLYKFARHEYVGISAAWGAMERMTESTPMIAKIGLYHLCEEFSHMRLFQEIFRTFHLDQVEWVPLGKWMSRMYRLFPMFPEAMLAPPAFVSELMGLTVYAHIDGVLDDILADEPEARERGSPHGGIDVSGVLPRHSGDDTTLQRRADGEGREGVRLQHHCARDAREELGALVLQGVDVIPGSR